MGASSEKPPHMIKKVVSHAWKRRGFSTLLLQLTAAQGEDRAAVLTLQGVATETMPYLVSISAGPHPWTGSGETSESLQIMDTLVPASVLTHTSATFEVNLRPHHVFLRLDFVGNQSAACHSAAELFNRGRQRDTAFAEMASHLIFEGDVQHCVTVTLDAAAVAAQQGAAPQRGTMASTTLLREELLALRRERQQLEDECAWYCAEAVRWEVEKERLLSDVRRGPTASHALQTPHMPTS